MKKIFILILLLVSVGINVSSPGRIPPDEFFIAERIQETDDVVNLVVLPALPAGPVINVVRLVIEQVTSRINLLLLFTLAAFFLFVVRLLKSLQFKILLKFAGPRHLLLSVMRI